MLLKPPRSTLFPYTTLFRSLTLGITPPTLERRVSRCFCVIGAARCLFWRGRRFSRSEEHTSELQSHSDLVCRLLLEKKMTAIYHPRINYPGFNVDSDTESQH